MSPQQELELRRKVEHSARVDLHQARRCLDYLRDFVMAKEAKRTRSKDSTKRLLEMSNLILICNEYLEELEAERI